MPNFPPVGPRIPPLPQFVVFTDRDDGTEWVLSFAAVDGVTYISINDQALERNNLPDRVDAHYVGKEGVPIGEGLRLFVRGGRLGYEMVQYVARRPVWARKGVKREAYPIIIPSSYRTFGDVLGWDDNNPVP